MKKENSTRKITKKSFLKDKSIFSEPIKRIIIILKGSTIKSSIFPKIAENLKSKLTKKWGADDEFEENRIICVLNDAPPVLKVDYIEPEDFFLYPKLSKKYKRRLKKHLEGRFEILEKNVDDIEM